MPEQTRSAGRPSEPPANGLTTSLDASPIKACEWRKFFIDAKNPNSLNDQVVSGHLPLCRITERRGIDRRYLTRSDFDTIHANTSNHARVVIGSEVVPKLLADEIASIATYCAFAS